MPQKKNHLTGKESRGEQESNRLSGAFGAASAVGEMARTAADTATEKADDAAASLGGSMQSLAGNLRTHAPQTGRLGEAATGLAEGLDRAGRYLKDEGVQGLAQDVSHLIRRHPLPAILMGMGLGFFAAQLLRGGKS